MKSTFLSVVMSLTLVFGAFCLFTPPAKADIPCLINCVNDRSECFAAAREICIGQPVGCVSSLRNICREAYNECVGVCGICPI